MVQLMPTFSVFNFFAPGANEKVELGSGHVGQEEFILSFICVTHLLHSWKSLHAVWKTMGKFTISKTPCIYGACMGIKGVDGMSVVCSIRH